MADDIYAERFRSQIADDIAYCGQHLVGVMTDPAFIYTIGNHEKRLPELLLIGIIDTYTINELGRRMRERGKAFEHGEKVSLGGTFPLKIISADPALANADYTIQAHEYYGRPSSFQVQQILVPDKSGVFPDERGCESPYADIPVLRVKVH